MQCFSTLHHKVRFRWSGIRPSAIPRKVLHSLQRSEETLQSWIPRNLGNHVVRRTLRCAAPRGAAPPSRGAAPPSRGAAPPSRGEDRPSRRDRLEPRAVPLLPPAGRTDRPGGTGSSPADPGRGTPSRTEPQPWESLGSFLVGADSEARRCERVLKLLVVHRAGGREAPSEGNTWTSFSGTQHVTPPPREREPFTLPLSLVIVQHKQSPAARATQLEPRRFRTTAPRERCPGMRRRVTAQRWVRRRVRATLDPPAGSTGSGQGPESAGESDAPPLDLL